MKRAIIESPFAPRTLLPDQHRHTELCQYCHARALRENETVLHARYLNACLLDCLRRGEAPFASHGLYTRQGVLNDAKPEERAASIAAGFVWRRGAHLTALYVDLGWSDGMRKGYDDAQALHRERPDHEIHLRVLGGEWAQYRALTEKYPH